MSLEQISAQGVLFDMDGVLVSSLGSVERSWRRWAAEFGVPNAATLAIPHGTRAVDIIRMLRPRLDVATGLARIDEIELNDLDGVTALDGARALLEQLPKAMWCVVTSARRSLMQARMQAAGFALPAIAITADDVREGKPHPEPYMRGAAALGLAADACLVVEDAPGGVRAGVAAGCRVLGVAGTHEAGELVEAGAAWVVESLAEASWDGVRLVVSK